LQKKAAPRNKLCSNCNTLRAPKEREQKKLLSFGRTTFTQFLSAAAMHLKTRLPQDTGRNSAFAKSARSPYFQIKGAFAEGALFMDIMGLNFHGGATRK
jgi:hypothetical protein